MHIPYIIRPIETISKQNLRDTRYTHMYMYQVTNRCVQIKETFSINDLLYVLHRYKSAEKIKFIQEVISCQCRAKRK